MKAIFRVFLGVLVATASTAGVLTAAGQSAQAGRTISNDDWCDQDWGGDREHFCEVREFTVARPSQLDVTRVSNGSIRVTGSNRSDVLIRARVVAQADTVEEARTLARDVEVSVENGRVRTDGPNGRGQRWWTVSYRVETPRAIDLELESSNGSIDVSNVDGRLRASTSNGSMHLSELAGDVVASTSNGSMVVTLAGTSWQGSGFEGTTSNGSMRVEVPDNYNARLVAGTGNGSLSIGFPVQVQGQLNRRLDVTLGNGGPTIRVQSGNGAVRINRR